MKRIDAPANKRSYVLRHAIKMALTSAVVTLPLHSALASEATEGEQVGVIQEAVRDAVKEAVQDATKNALQDEAVQDALKQVILRELQTILGGNDGAVAGGSSQKDQPKKVVKKPEAPKNLEMQSVNVDKVDDLVQSTPAAMEIGTSQSSEKQNEVVAPQFHSTLFDELNQLDSIDASDLERASTLNIDRYLFDLPWGTPSLGTFSNNPGNGTARANLRGLGTSRTLVNVNGRRFIPVDTSGSIDLNNIPVALLQQVENLGPASSLYGSGAIGGALNFDWRNDVQGFELSTTLDSSAEHDAETFSADAIFGGKFAEGRGYLMGYVGYLNRDSLQQGERDFSSFSLTDAAPVGTPGQDPDTGVGGPLDASGSSGVPGTRVFSGPTIVVNGEAFTLGTFDESGQGLPWVEPDSRFNYAPFNFLQTPQDRFMGALVANYEIGTDHEAYMEFLSASNDTASQLAPTPAFLSSLEVNPNSAFFSPEVQAGLNTLSPNNDGNVYLPFIGRRTVEVGNREIRASREASRIAFGLRGDLTDSWTYDLSYQLQQSETIDQIRNDVYDSRFRQAVLTNDNGTACQDSSNGCVPMNIFGPGNISSAAGDFVRAEGVDITDVEQHLYNLSLHGNVGPLSTLIGFEHREDDATFTPSGIFTQGDTLGFAGSVGANGGFNLDELYGGVGFGQGEDLSIWIGGRSSDHSVSGTATSYSGLVNYQFSDRLAFSADYHRSFRTPSITELYEDITNEFPGAIDPCSIDGQAGTDIFNTGQVGAALRMVCEQSGVAPSQVGFFIQPNSQIEGIFGGNRNLEEEVSDNIILGVAMEPLDNLLLEVDYFEYDISNTIDVLGGGVNNILNVCYNVVQDINDQYCQAVTRSSAGTISQVSALNANVGNIETSGIDIRLNYAKDLEWDMFGDQTTLVLNARATRWDDYTLTPVAALEDQFFECAGFFGDTCGVPRPELTANALLALQTELFEISFMWHHIGEVDDDQISINGVDPSSLSVPTLDALNYIDVTAGYNMSDNLRINLGVKNLTEEQPTFIGSSQSQANTWPNLYDLIGRRYFLNLRYSK